MALRSFFYCLLFFHPNSTFHCLRLTSHPPSPRRKKTPNRTSPSPSLSASSPRAASCPSSPLSSLPTSSSSYSNPWSYMMDLLSKMYKKKDKSRAKSHRDITSHDSQSMTLDPFKPKTTCSSPCRVESARNNDRKVSEIVEGEHQAWNVIQTIFQKGWTNKENNPTIVKILKIHHSKEMFKRFEEYREMVKLRAARTSTSKRKERWVADGNELLRFHCSALTCPLGYRGSSSICWEQCCCICNIISYGFSARVDEKLIFCERSWRAHEMMKVSGDEDETSKGEDLVMRAMFVCRVIAGRVAYDRGRGLVEGEEGGFDSLVGEERDLLVMDPNSVLPCFIVIYN